MRIWGALLVGVAFLSGCATPVRQAEVRQAREVPRGADAKPIQFKKVVVKLRRGEEIGNSHVGLACLPQSKVEWKGGKVNITDEEFTEAFREELEKYNYPVVGDPNALFDDPSSWKAELLVAGQVNKLDISVCYPKAGFGNFKESKGGAFVRVHWQVFGQLERKVVYETTTEGSFQSDSSVSYGIEKSLTNAFAAAVQNLLAEERFHRLVTRSSSTPGGTAIPPVASAAPLELLVSTVGAPSLDAARKATVTVFAGSGHGSGFIVSPDGYVLTNEHVVREARFVTVRLSNGRETLGDVVRVSSPRDVAVIRLREQNLPAVRMAVNFQPSIGSDVYAIGTPRRVGLDTTMTRGIVSAYRDEHGQKYLQSDVQIHPGNSGGPLVAADGRVVGIAVQGLMAGNASQNLNFFVPIDEAIAALNLQLR